MECAKSFKLDENKKQNLVQNIIRKELDAFTLLINPKVHPRYNQIMTNTDKEYLMKKDIQSLLRRRESLSVGESLSQHDVETIFKHKGMEAIGLFNWTNLVSNEVAFWILEETKHQLKERNEPKQSTTATDPNTAISKDLRTLLLNQTKMMDQFAKKLNNIEKTMSIVTQKIDVMEEKMNNIKGTIQDLKQNENLLRLYHDEEEIVMEEEVEPKDQPELKNEPDIEFIDEPDNEYFTATPGKNQLENLVEDLGIQITNDEPQILF